MALVNDEPNRLAIDALDLRPSETVLELGFGPGWGLRAIAARTRGARVYGVDQSARMLRQARRINEVAVSRGRMVLVQGPFSPLPWVDEMFDKILLVNVAYITVTNGKLAFGVKGLIAVAEKSGRSRQANFGCAILPIRRARSVLGQSSSRPSKPEAIMMTALMVKPVM